MRKSLILLLVVCVGCASATSPSFKSIPELSFPERQIIAVMEFENKSGNMTDEETAIRSALNIAVKQLVNDVAYRTPVKN